MVFNLGSPPGSIITIELMMMIIIKQDLPDMHASLHDGADRRRSYCQNPCFCAKRTGEEEKGKEKWRKGEEVEGVERFPDSKI
jgi:hypothetical protein